MGTHANAIQTYIRAKDGNRPHLMADAFAPDANLKMRVATGNISFPPVSKGIEAITQLLVRDFGRAHENVYSQEFEGKLPEGGSPVQAFVTSDRP